MPSSASFIAEDLERAFAGFRRKFHVNDDEEEDEDETVINQDAHVTLVSQARRNDSLTRPSRPFEDLPSASAAAATAASVIERAAAAALAFEVPNTSRMLTNTSNVLLSSSNSAKLTGTKVVSQNPIQNKASLSRGGEHGKTPRRKKGEPEFTPMTVTLQGMAEKLDMQMLCMSRRLATFSGDSDLLQPAVATFKATMGLEDAKASENPVTAIVNLQQASTDVKDDAERSIVSTTPLDQSSSSGRPPLPLADISLRASKRTDLQELRRSWEQLSASNDAEKAGKTKTVREEEPETVAQQQPLQPQQDEASSKAASEASAMFMPSELNRSTRRNPSAAWFDAVSSALRGDVKGTLAALEEKTAAELQELAALEELEKANSLRNIHEEAGEALALARAPRLDLSLQPEGRLSPDFESSLKTRWQGTQMPQIASASSSSSHVVMRPQQPRVFPAQEKEQTVTKAIEPASSSSPAPPLTLPATAAEAAAETAAFLSSLGPSLGSVPFDLKSELSSRASASGAALEAGGPSKGIPLGPKPSAASSFIPLTAFIPPVVRPRAIYGPDGRISLVSGPNEIPDPYQSLAVAAAAEGRPLFPNGPGAESKSALFDFSAIQAQALDGSARFRSSVSASDLRSLPTLPPSTSSDSSASQTANFSSTFAATSRAALPAPHTLPTYVSPQGDLPPPPISPPLGFFGFAGQPPASQDLYRQLERYFLEELKVPPTTQGAFSGNFQKTWPTHALPPNVPVSFHSRPTSKAPSAIASPVRPYRESKQSEPASTSSLSAEVDRLLHEHRDLEKRTLENWATSEGASALSGTGGLRDRPRLSVPSTFYSQQSVDAQGAVRRAQVALQRLDAVRAAIAVDQHYEYDEGGGYVDLQG